MIQTSMCITVNWHTCNINMNRHYFVGVFWSMRYAKLIHIIRIYTGHHLRNFVFFPRNYWKNIYGKSSCNCCSILYIYIQYPFGLKHQFFVTKPDTLFVPKVIVCPNFQFRIRKKKFFLGYYVYYVCYSILCILCSM